jgi:hypothetical protein
MHIYPKQKQQCRIQSNINRNCITLHADLKVFINSKKFLPQIGRSYPYNRIIVVLRFIFSMIFFKKIKKKKN